MEPKNIIIKDIDNGLYVYDVTENDVFWTKNIKLAQVFESAVDAQEVIDNRISSSINVDTVTL